MHNEPKNFRTIFGVGSSIYSMPLYQRSYCWGEKDLNLFKDDIEQLVKYHINDDKKKVYLGAIILMQRETRGINTAKEFFIIDGQQRLTTVYLFILASLEYSVSKNLNINLKEYLLSGAHGSVDYPKIRVTSLDTNQFNKILKHQNNTDLDIKTEEGFGEKEGALVDAYTFLKNEVIHPLVDQFMENFDNRENCFNKIINLVLNNMVVTDIELSSDYNPNEVFDRLNTKGKKLDTLDLVRNIIFMKTREMTDIERNDFYEDKWKPFENKLKKKWSDRKKQNVIDKQANDYFFPYSLNIDSSIAKRSLVSKLQEIFHKKDPQSIIKELSGYIKPYQLWLQGNNFNSRIPKNYSSELRQKIIDIHQLGIPKATLCFLMRCIYEFNKKRLLEGDLIEIFSIYESFLFRRAYAESDEFTGLHAIFKKLWERSQGDPKKVRKYISSRTKSFPDDESFRSGILKNDLYKKNIEKYALLNWERYLAQKKKENLIEYNHGYPKNIIKSTDHINPKSKKGLKKNELKKHEETKHLWGNLLPMSSPLNQTKHSKRDISTVAQILTEHSQYESTKDWLKDYSDNKEFRAKQIIERSEKIARWAIKRWPN